jgi:hypothetical protein
MRKLNYALKSRRRKRLSVEVLEGRQLMATITVNTTLDNSPADSTLSLRDAIEVSNGALAVSALSTQAQHQITGAVGATNTIDFSIPISDPGYNMSTGVWTMAMKSALPAISTNAAIIDGYSQPGASKNTLAQGDNAKIAVAIDGTAIQSTGPGLLIDQTGTQVLGLDIENFGQLGEGVLIRSATNVQIAGCFIGVDPTGETAATDGIGVEVFNSFNIIGGPNVGDRNVISGNLGDGIYVPDKSYNPLQITQTGNVTENNYIGLDAAGKKAVTNHGYGVDDFGSGNTYGGMAPGTGNVISGNFYGGINSEGSIAVEGNYIGTDATGKVALGNGTPGTAVGDFEPAGTTSVTMTITDNVISGDVYGIYLGEAPGSQSTCTISNNKIGSDVTGTKALGNIATGLVVTGPANAVIQNNVISANKIGVVISGNAQTPVNDVLQGNFVGTDKTGLVPMGNAQDGIEINASNVTVGGGGPGQANVIENNGGYGIDLLTGQNDTFSQNSIFGNSNAGIHENFGTNNSVSPPVLTFTPGAGSSGTLSVKLTGAANTTYVVEVFSNASAPTTGHEQGQTFVKAVSVTTDSSGRGSFSMTEPTAYYTASATDPGGNTSQFSNATGSQLTLPASATVVSSSQNPSTVGQPVTFTAVVTAPGFQGTPTGTVTFTIDGHAQTPVTLSVVGGKDEARFTTSTLAAGQHSVSASYSGDTNVSGSSGSLATQTVNALPATTTTLSSSLNPSTVGQPVTFTAVVTAPGFQGTPTGTVTFTIDGHAQTPVTLSVIGGKDEAQFTTSTLSAGSHTVSASFSGDAKVSASSGSLPAQTVVAPSLHATTTSLASSLNPSTVGQPVTFTAIVSPNGSAGSPSGSVTFTIDGVSEAPEQLHMVGGTDEAILTLTSLAKGTHSIKAAYSGDSSFAASAVASPLIQKVSAVVLPGGDGPTIDAVKRYGIHMQPTVVVVTFNDPLDPTSAVNLSSYRITDPSGHAVAIKSAVFDAATNSVTLRTAERINLHHTYHFTVIGTGKNGVRNMQGVLLDGAGTGSPGSNYTGTLTWRNVVLTPAEVEKYVHPTQFKPGGALSHRFLNRSH